MLDNDSWKEYDSRVGGWKSL